MNQKYSKEVIKSLYEGSRLNGVKHKFLAKQYEISSVSYVSDLIRAYEKENNL